MKPRIDPHPELTAQYEPQRARCKPLTCHGKADGSCWVRDGVAVLAGAAVGRFFTCCPGTPATRRLDASKHGHKARIVP